jgi:hypothetical protein
MTSLEIDKQIFFAKGGKITKCRPSNKRPEPKRSPFSVFNIGAKKNNLRNIGYAQ